MEPPTKPLDYLPTTSAKWTLWISLFLATLPYALPQSALKDMRLSEETLLWCLRLLMSALLLLAGAYLTLFLVVRHSRKNTGQLNIGLTNPPELAERLQRAKERMKESDKEVKRAQELPAEFEEITEKVLFFVANFPNKTTQEIGKSIKENTQLTLWHLEKLEGFGLISHTYHSLGKSWQPTPRGRDYMAKNDMFIKPKV